MGIHVGIRWENKNRTGFHRGPAAGSHAPASLALMLLIRASRQRARQVPRAGIEGLLSGRRRRSTSGRRAGAGWRRVWTRPGRAPQALGSARRRATWSPKKDRAELAASDRYRSRECQYLARLSLLRAVRKAGGVLRRVVFSKNTTSAVPKIACDLMTRP